MPSSTPTLREPISRSPPRPRAAGEPASVTRGPSGTTTDRRPAFRQPTAAGVAIPEPHRNPRPCHVTKHAPDRPPRGPSRPGCWPRTLGVIDGSRSSRRIRPTSRAWVCPPPGLQRRRTPGIANGLRFSVGARAPHRRRGADRRGIGGRTGWGRLRSGAVDCAVIPPVDWPCRVGPARHRSASAMAALVLSAVSSTRGRSARPMKSGRAMTKPGGAVSLFLGGAAAP